MPLHFFSFQGGLMIDGFGFPFDTLDFTQYYCRYFPQLLNLVSSVLQLYLSPWHQ